MSFYIIYYRIYLLIMNKYMKFSQTVLLNIMLLNFYLLSSLMGIEKNNKLEESIFREETNRSQDHVSQEKEDRNLEINNQLDQYWENFPQDKILIYKEKFLSDLKKIIHEIKKNKNLSWHNNILCDETNNPINAWVINPDSSTKRLVFFSCERSNEIMGNYKIITKKAYTIDLKILKIIIKNNPNLLVNEKKSDETFKESIKVLDKFINNSDRLDGYNKARFDLTHEGIHLFIKDKQKKWETIGVLRSETLFNKYETSPLFIFITKKTYTINLKILKIIIKKNPNLLVNEKKSNETLKESIQVLDKLINNSNRVNGYNEVRFDLTHEGIHLFIKDKQKKWETIGLLKSETLFNQYKESHLFNIINNDELEIKKYFNELDIEIKEKLDAYWEKQIQKWGKFQLDISTAVYEELKKMPELRVIEKSLCDNKNRLILFYNTDVKHLNEEKKTEESQNQLNEQNGKVNGKPQEPKPILYYLCVMEGSKIYGYHHDIQINLKQLIKVLEKNPSLLLVDPNKEYPNFQRVKENCQSIMEDLIQANKKEEERVKRNINEQQNNQEEPNVEWQQRINKRDEEKITVIFQLEGNNIIIKQNDKEIRGVFKKGILNAKDNKDKFFIGVLQIAE